MMEIRGLVLDTMNGYTLALSKVKLFASDTLVEESLADFDGKYRFRFCSNRIKTDSLILEAEVLGYHVRSFAVRAETNLSIDIHLEIDPTVKITEQSRKEYLDSIYRNSRSCGTEEFSRDYENDPMFRHCDGRIEPFRKLIERNERMEEWKKL
jgi:hypothetical protein